MDDRPPEGEAGPQDMIAATELLFLSTARALSEALKRLEAGDIDKAAELPGAIAMVRKALVLALTERQAVGKSRNEGGAGGGGGVPVAALDLAAARDEVGRRLARLRDAGGSGAVSGRIE
ncbi:MAG: hypothetical protein JJU40_06435 [Rhodobacteraceae bacterium]|nr:hypothetical protein [Paracoccaceae bacterium]